MTAGRMRIQWLCRRGMKELDLLLQGYLASRFEQAEEAEREAFLALLELPDDRLTRYLLGLERPEDARMGQVVAHIRAQLAA